MLLALLLSLSALSGCKKIKLYMGWGYVVTEADLEEESPQWVVYQVLKAASMEDFDEAWGAYQKFLHSDEYNSNVAMKEWETLRLPTLRRKVKCFLRPDDGDGDPYTYQVMEEKIQREDYMQLRVKCKTTDMPTPCHLVQDPEQGGKWRIKWNCLN